MNELTVFNFNQVDVVDSRDVAKLTERNHKDLLRDLRGYVRIMEESNGRNFAPVGTERKIAPSDFFIPSTYQDGKGETRPCYLLTKKGCDMVANKMTGEKGVLFTAAYVTAFEKMREKVEFELPKDYPSALRALADAEEKRLSLAAENEAQRQDAILTINMVKEICMLQRNEKGKQARQYFLQLERDWNSPEKVMARALRLLQHGAGASSTARDGPPGR